MSNFWIIKMNSGHVVYHRKYTKHTPTFQTIRTEKKQYGFQWTIWECWFLIKIEYTPSSSGESASPVSSSQVDCHHSSLSTHNHFTVTTGQSDKVQFTSAMCVCDPHHVRRFPLISTALNVQGTGRGATLLSLHSTPDFSTWKRDKW